MTEKILRPLNFEALERFMEIHRKIANKEQMDVPCYAIKNMINAFCNYIKDPCLIYLRALGRAMNIVEDHFKEPAHAG